MNWIDLLLAVIILLGAWAGWQRGFVRATLFLLTLAAALAAAFLLYRYPAAWLNRAVPTSGVWAAPASFLLLFIGVQLLLDRVAYRLIVAVPRRAHEHGINRLLGLAPGTVNGAINAVVVSVLLLTVPFLPAVSSEARDSRLAERLAEPAEWVEARLLPIFDPAVRRTLQALTVPADSRQSVQLPFRTTRVKPRPDLEARMLQLVNDERAREGLKPLQPDAEAAEVARAHSRDMFARGYFSHVSPDGGTLADRYRKGEVRFLLAGENLALAHSLSAAHQGLMNSPGHRANILRPQFGRVGIGILDGGVHGLMVTQNFRN